MSPSPAEIRTVLRQTLAWSKRQDYLEHTKHDALNSPALMRLFGFSRWSRIFITQAVMRSPVDLRTVLGVKRSLNPKGLALFVLALLDLYELDQDQACLVEAQRLLALLARLRSGGNWAGDCWGYQYPWQDLGFFAPSGTPNAVVTAFVCEAYLRAYRITGENAYLETVVSATRFFLTDLTVLASTADELCLAYMPLHMKMRVMDVSILIAAVLSQVHRLRPEARLDMMARRLTTFVVNRQTTDGAWFYTDPPEDSPVKIDNYHTGFILDALRRIADALGSAEWDECYARGAAFYAHNLFNGDGSPRWMSDRDFPHDIHGAAQGVLTFSQAANLRTFPGLADRVEAWALGNMYHKDGRFFYQKHRFYTRTTTYLRWCNAWMCRALAASLRQRQT